MAAPVSSVMSRARKTALEFHDGPLTLGSMSKYDIDMSLSSHVELTTSPSQFRPYRIAMPESDTPPAGMSGALALSYPSAAGGLRYDDGPLVLMSGGEPNASVMVRPLTDLHVDEDGVVLFGTPPLPARESISRDELRR
jgi:hypothetical protein